jgi:hypothetical protein
MATSRRTVLVLSTLLALSLGTCAVLGYLLYAADRDTTVARRKAWRSCRKLSMQHLLFVRARERARREGRKLVVIGNPTGGYVNKVVPIYGCGDVCIDIAGCRPCAPTTEILKMDAIKALRRLPADSAVVFESEVLEYVGDMSAAVAEIDRITGRDHTRIYAVHSISIDPWPYHTKGKRPAAPNRAVRRKRRKGRKKYAKTGEGLARRIIYRFPPRDRYHWVEL